MSIRINALRNVGAVFETAQILVKQNGLLGLALLPFCHVGYVQKEDAQFAHIPQFERVVKKRQQLPDGAIVTQELKDGQLAHEVLVRNEGDDWIASVHTDEPHPTSWSGDWPVSPRIIPNSAHLTEEQAVQRAREEFKGK